MRSMPFTEESLTQEPHVFSWTEKSSHFPLPSAIKGSLCWTFPILPDQEVLSMWLNTCGRTANPRDLRQFPE